MVILYAFIGGKSRLESQLSSTRICLFELWRGIRGIFRHFRSVARSSAKASSSEVAILYLSDVLYCFLA